MTVFGIDIGQIVDLSTQVANAGAMRALESAGDEMFEYLITVAIIVYEQTPR